MTINIERLEELARKATKKWSFDVERSVLLPPTPGNDNPQRITRFTVWAGEERFICVNDPTSQQEFDFRYIASASPDVVLALCKVARAAKEYVGYAHLPDLEIRQSSIRLYEALAELEARDG